MNKSIAQYLAPRVETKMQPENIFFQNNEDQKNDIALLFPIYQGIDSE